MVQYSGGSGATTEAEGLALTWGYISIPGSKKSKHYILCTTCTNAAINKDK